MHKGLLNVASIVGLVGAGSLDYNSTAPWAQIVTHAGSSIGQGIREAFDGQRLRFDGLVHGGLSPDLADQYVGRDVARAGVFPNCVVPSTSLTKKWNDEFEAVRFESLSHHFSTGGPTNRLNPAFLAFQNVDTFSSQFLRSRPDSIGHLSDIQFRISVATFLGQPCPLYKNFQGCFIGHKSKVVEVDQYGHSAAAHGGLPGAHHAKAHKDIQRSLAGLASAAQLPVVLEGKNTFAGLVPADAFDRYLSHYSQVQAGHHSDALIPDVIISDYPMMSGGVSFEEAPRRTAILETKGIHFCKSRYGLRHRNPARPYGSSESDRATDRRAREIKKEYVTKCQKMDERFASTNQANEATGQQAVRGPFESALEAFAYDGVIPCVFGSYGEVNQEFHKVISTLARVAAVQGKGAFQLLSPELTTVHRYSYIVSEFRRAFGLTLTRANANLKLARSHLIARSPELAKRQAEAALQRQSFHKKPRDQPSWFTPSAVDQEAILAWQRFRSNRATSGLW